MRPVARNASGGMEQLANSASAPSVAALCRVMRFEIDPVLSKRAALLAMAVTLPESVQQRRELAGMVRSTVAGSRRPAGQWLLAYASTLEEPLSALGEWARLTAQETEVLARFSEETDEQIVRDLLRWRTEVLLRLDRNEEALGVLRQTLPLLGDDREGLVDMLDWAVAHRVWQMADDLAERFPEQFDGDPLLLYRWAEAQRQSGRKELGEQTAQRALVLNPERPEHHIETARKLSERMLYDWAEREARRAVDATEATKESGLEARLYLSDLLFDLAQELAAAEVLQETVEALNNDDRVLQEFNRPIGVVRSLMHYRYAMHLAKTGDRENQRKRLEEAIRQHPIDVDVLIAMYRLSESEPEWRPEVLERVNAVAGKTAGCDSGAGRVGPKPAKPTVSARHHRPVGIAAQPVRLAGRQHRGGLAGVAVREPPLARALSRQPVLSRYAGPLLLCGWGSGERHPLSGTRRTARTGHSAATPAVGAVPSKTEKKTDEKKTDRKGGGQKRADRI